MSRSIACRFSVHVVLCLLALNVALTPELAAARSAEAQERAATEAQLEQIERAFDALEKAAAEIPRDTFDPEAILDLVDPEIEPLFEWVRDNTYLVPYQGALRGPVGVVMDRMGNSLDRALLLNTLLQQVGYETRIANGRLLPEAARDLMASARAVPAEGAIPEETQAEEDAIAELQRYVAEFGLDEKTLINERRETVREGERLRAEAQKRVREQTKFLAELIGPLPEGAAEEQRRRQLATLEDHWWVQVQDGRRWVDLDPGYPNSPSGWAATVPRRTLEVEKLGDLGRDSLHTVQIRLILECWQGGNLAEHALLESDPLLPVELLGKPLTLRHIPVGWPAEQDLLAAADPAKLLLETAANQDLWVPVLSLGSKNIMSLAYRGSCVLSPASEALNPTAQVGRAVEKKLGGLAGAIGGFGGVAEEESTAEKEAGRLTAQWIEYEIRVPGEQPEVIRRQIFDRIGAEVRREPESLKPEALVHDDSWRLALLGTTDILVLASELSSAFVDELLTSSLRLLRDPIVGILRGAVTAEDLETLPRLETPSVELLALALARQEPQGFAGRSFAERPNVMAFHRQLKAVGASGVAALQAFDIVANRVGAIDRGGEPARLARLAQGVSDSNAEALLAEALCEPGASSMSCQPSNGVADLLAESADPKRWIVLRSTNDLDRIGEGVSRAQRIRMEIELAGGAVLVRPSPDSSPDWAGGHWWRVDPVRGDALTIEERGWGAQFVEFLIGGLDLAAGVLCVLSTIECGNPVQAGLCALGFGFLSLAVIFKALSFGGLIASNIFLLSWGAISGPSWWGSC